MDESQSAAGLPKAAATCPIELIPPMESAERPLFSLCLLLSSRVVCLCPLRVLLLIMDEHEASRQIVLELQVSCKYVDIRTRLQHSEQGKMQYTQRGIDGSHCALCFACTALASGTSEQMRIPSVACSPSIRSRVNSIFSRTQKSCGQNSHKHTHSNKSSTVLRDTVLMRACPLTPLLPVILSLLQRCPSPKVRQAFDLQFFPRS